MYVSQSWEGDRSGPSGSLLKGWQQLTIPSVVVGCGEGCPCVDKNPKCATWAKEGQCEANPGYMSAECAASCPSTSNSSGWKLTAGTSVTTPTGDCLDTAGQLTPAPGSGLNWLRPAKCDASSPTQKWTYTNNMLVVRSHRRAAASTRCTERCPWGCDCRHRRTTRIRAPCALGSSHTGSGGSRWCLWWAAVGSRPTSRCPTRERSPPRQAS